MNIAIASDHGGYDLKMDLSAWLREQVAAWRSL